MNDVRNEQKIYVFSNVYSFCFYVTFSWQWYV